LDLTTFPSQVELLSEVQLKVTKVVDQLKRELDLGGVVDEYLTDQIVIFMALATAGAEGRRCAPNSIGRRSLRRRSEVLVGEISSHTLTAMKLAEDMLGNISFSTKSCGNGGNVLICEQLNEDQVRWGEQGEEVQLRI